MLCLFTVYYLIKRTMKKLLQILTLNLIFASSLMAQDEEFGLASYYSDLFHGKPTASGELYDKNKYTCAHKTYPFGTMLRVTRLDNNKSVEVRVTDRGPFISGRVVEISRAAAERIGLIEDGGSAKVKVELSKAAQASEPVAEVTKPAAEEKTTREVAKQEEPKKDEPAPKPAETKPEKATITEKSVATTKKAEVAKEEPKSKPATAKAEPKPEAKPATNSKATLVKGNDFEPYDLFEIELKKPEKKGFGVQVAVLTSQEALFKKIGELQEKWFDSILISVQKNPKGENLYKVILGSFPTEGEANNYRNSLKKNKKMEGFVVDLSSMDTKN